MATVYGLIGYPLTHSWSAAYFADKFRREGIRDADYRAFPLKDIGRLPELVRQTPGLKGLNVTIPHKERVLEFLDDLSDTARTIGAVNTVTVTHRQGKVFLSGDNTDAFGFWKSLEEFGVLAMDLAKRPDIKGAMVLGTGGASRAVCHVLESQGWTVQLVTRSPAKRQDNAPGAAASQTLTPQAISRQAITYDEIRQWHFQSCSLIVNTTPLGMFPETTGHPPIPYQYLSKEHVLYDLVYNPETTRFMEMGKKAGCRVMGGYRMLVLQAERSWEIWNR